MTNKKATSFRLSPETEAALSEMAALTGMTRTGVFEIITRWAMGSKELKQLLGVIDNGTVKSELQERKS